MNTIEEKIHRAMKYNMICVDEDAKQGEITDKLIHIMKQCMLDNFGEDMKKIYTTHDNISKHNIEIIELDKDYTYFYLEEGGWLGDDKFILIGESENKFLLGRY